MARTDKDIDFKQDALRFCVGTNQVPYLEVLVSSAIEMSDTERLITDIDVLGVDPHHDGRIQRTIFDCKSSKTPPIGRAFWQAGLMQFVGATEGFVILGRRAERAHRLAAQTIGVRLFDRGGFLAYAMATSPSVTVLSSYACEPENWHRISDAGRKANCFDVLERFLYSEVPLAPNPTRAFRKLISVTREHKGELDPAKAFHMALFAEIVCATTLLLVPMIGDLRNLVELSDDLDEFSSILRLYIWGGRDGLQILNRINEARPDRPDQSAYENSSLAWPSLLQLARFMLEAPTALALCCLPARELALRFLADPHPASDLSLGFRLSQKRVRQFMNRIAAYVAAAGRLPHDFSIQYGREIDSLIGQYEREDGK